MTWCLPATTIKINRSHPWSQQQTHENEASLCDLDIFHAMNITLLICQWCVVRFISCWVFCACNHQTSRCLFFALLRLETFVIIDQHCCNGLIAISLSCWPTVSVIPLPSHCNMYLFCSTQSYLLYSSFPAVVFSLRDTTYYLSKW